MSPLASLCTPRGRAAIATIRVDVDVRNCRSDQSLPFAAANGRPLVSQPYGQIVFGRWGNESSEDVVLCAVDSRTLEIHCHGGHAAPDRILADLARVGCRIVEWPQLARECGLLEAELLEELANATTVRGADVLLEQSAGLLRSAFESLESQANDPGRLVSRINELIRWAPLGLHLTRPWNVVIAGRPNVGKSSLLNALLGYSRSIVFEQPGTTRDVVTARTSIDGWPVEISDTAGIRDSAEPIEAAGVTRALETLRNADMALVLVDVSGAFSDDDRTLLAACPRALPIAHKCDLPPFRGPGGQHADSRSWIRVSSKTGQGIDSLLSSIVKRLVPEAPPAGTPIPVTPRQVHLLERAAEAALRGDVAACRKSIRGLLD